MELINSARLKSDEHEYIDFFPPGYEIGRTKYIIITGGVMSGVGKGVFNASLSHLLQVYGYTVSPIKIDGYLNQDAGTLNPYRHGEVFVLDDGTECDMDLGTYERFLDTDLNRKNYITSGQVYALIIEKERRGDYLGRDVLVIPHVTGEIKYLLRGKAMEKPYDIILVEIGGTIGDIENLHFVEAARQMAYEEGKRNFMFVHLTPVLYSEASGEQKSKPTQHSVKRLLEIGVQPDLIVCRSKEKLRRGVKEKISLYCNIPVENVISSPQMSSIYTLPQFLDEQNVIGITTDILSLPKREEPKDKPFSRYVNYMSCSHRKIPIAITGKYTTVKDSYISITNALEHVEPFEDIEVDIKWIDTSNVEDEDIADQMEGIKGLIVPGGFGVRGAEGKIKFINYARVHNLPYLGLCYGFQLAVVEFVRNVCGIKDACSTELDPDTTCPVIYLLPAQRDVAGMGGSMRLGGHDVSVKEGTLAHKLYDSRSLVRERFRHRYELNVDYQKMIEEKGVVFSGMTPDGKIMQILELPDHKFFIGTQFHPEYTSRPLHPHPFFWGFIRAAKEY